jgi:predicted ArsR family transcriptional regulator
VIPRSNKRFWNSTRGRIVLLLRRESQTVQELAEALGITDNAVRAQLVALERDGLVRQSGARPGTRKPKLVYELTPEADQLFPKVYGPLLCHFLDVLKDDIASKKLNEIVRTVGRRMALDYRPASRSNRPRERAEQAVAVLRELGGMCESISESKERNGRATIQCTDCPLAMIVVDHPEVCMLVETLLSEALGAPVRQRCQAEPSPRCRFEID